uniref:RING-type domain-containing protein n=1 Tax=Hucho hucho TaxID=62062 RepID=A0A4W5QPB3_9TELE
MTWSQERTGPSGGWYMGPWCCCHRFLGEPVTIGCGHSYCKRCVQHQLLSKCKLCSEVGGRPTTELKTNVILFGLLEKWFPEELKRSRAISEIEDLSRRKHFEEAVSLATDVIESGEVPACHVFDCRSLGCVLQAAQFAAFNFFLN